jgi:general secretion pathway protein D/MSHA biogenesis protein MshL
MWDGVQEALEQIAECDGCPAPVIDRALGMITINAPKKIHRNVQEYLNSLRKEAYKQVIIEAKILEVNLSDTHREGIDWGNIFNQRQIDGSISFGQLTNGLIYTTRDLHVGKILRDITLNSPINWHVVVSFFKQYGDTRIIANPKVSILNGHSAVLSAGQNRQYLESCDVTIEEIYRSLEAKINSVMEGLSIGIKANILGDDQVILYVFPAITRIIEMRDIFNSECGVIQAPETSVREMATFAKVKNNEVLVIGGLINKMDEEATEKIPYLGDIPLVGRLFKEELTDGQSSELVIIIKPRIMSMDGYVAEKQN